MRDILVLSIALSGAAAALRWPWIGVMLWTWVSNLNPHRMTYGFAYDIPIAAMAAGATLVGLMMTKERESPFKGPPVAILLVFAAWISISWLGGVDVSGDYAQWSKVMKIFFMIFVTLALLRTKMHMLAFVWTIVLSLGLLGAKGGLFTIATAGSARVFGPPETFIYENNAFAVAVVMTIPLIRFLQLQLAGGWARNFMTIWMLVMAVCALGSQSRGALLSISAMTLVLWWRQKKHRFLGGVLLAAFAVLLVAFMPDSWEARMSTIKTYDQDLSAMGRIAAWWVAWGIAWDYPLGVGFSAARPELFLKYSPHVHLLAGHAPVAHSIYFQMMGLHGFVGLFIFLAMWISTWFIAAKVRTMAKTIPQAAWCGDLAAMIQVSFVGYAVGGAFLDIGYFDLPYNMMVLIVLSKCWIDRKAWIDEAQHSPPRWKIPGVASIAK